MLSLEVFKKLSDKFVLSSDDFENVPDHPLFNITKGLEYSVTRKFINYMQGDMDFANCLTSFSFTDQIVTSCVGLLVQGPLRILKLEEALLVNFCIRELEYGAQLLLIVLPAYSDDAVIMLIASLISSREGRVNGRRVIQDLPSNGRGFNLRS